MILRAIVLQCVIGLALVVSVPAAEPPVATASEATADIAALSQLIDQQIEAAER